MPAEFKWYVVAVDGHEADYYVNAWGPFDGKTDAEAFNIDLAHDNGWTDIRTVYDPFEVVVDMTTDKKITYPYNK